MELRVLHFSLAESIMKLAKMSAKEHSKGSEFTKLCERREFHFRAQIPCEPANLLSAQQPWKWINQRQGKRFHWGALTELG